MDADEEKITGILRRLMRHTQGQKNRADCPDEETLALFLSGDLHALAEGKIQRYGELNFRKNPVISVLTGPISTGPKAWPSAWRGTPPQIPTGIEIEESLKPIEKNGFSIIDFTEDRIELQFTSWKLDEPEELLDNLKPFHRVVLERRR